MKNSCCQQLYDTTFNLERAQKELEEYLQNGIKKNSRPFLEAIRKLPLEGKSMLDIGSGIGALIFESFKKGIRFAMYNDFSAAYMQIFLSEANRQNLSDKITTNKGDFLDLHEKFEPADLVTLDKVICCYKDYEGLVRASVAKTGRWYMYSIPRDVWWVKLGHQLELVIKKIKGKPFRTYIHPAGEIEEMVLGAGFKKIEQQYQREWMVVVYEKEYF